MATIQSKGIFLSLVAQLDKLARHNRQGSFRTRERYYEACKRFCAYLAAEYHLQKLENISECFRIDTAAAERALRENTLIVKGKGGKVRTVPIEDERILMMLRKLLSQTERGHKLPVPDDMPTDRAINALELFIYRHRNEISDEGSDRRLTFHGLRGTPMQRSSTQG